ncbi:molybdate ABC transporter substrate-binding protein [Metabacillus halosaccharovorans]|uniref:molybdate ABC transporter substrate-binding protein n=1 Tax=Metabacillus halosaccharovorans TaxID=930124 RepID=UPI001C1FA35E|nr:molybdate ABC transporter substrate-binding protein [Metabacillus halosaccharovorans]MBU7595141.1 molybdate ABC transporter substrate-binding protein [Metabacillus halosaccharovorans]
MKKFSLLILVSIIMLFTAGCTSSGQDTAKPKNVDITVSAAASLTDALHDITTSFEKEYPNIKVTYNFGSSGTLQQQILQGAPADLFFSAAEDKFDVLVSEGLIDEKNGIDLVGNQLVLITPKEGKNDIQSFQDLDKVQKISIGTPETVPAGKYAQEMLENIDEWNEVNDKMVPAKDVRQVLTYVETGNVDAGIVYNTDAFISSKVNVIATAEKGTHTPIVYPLGILNESDHQKEAKVFYDYMQSEKALAILEKYGFLNLVK